MWFREAGDLERQRIRDVVQAAGGHPYPARHGAVEPVAETQASLTQVVRAGTAHHALAADLRGRLADDAVPLAEAADAGTGVRNRAAELVPEDHRHVHRPGVGVV